MSQKTLFDFVKGFLGGGGAPAPSMPRQPRGPRYEPPPPRAHDPDNHNPATIVRVGKSTDGRELVMTLGLGTFLVDREQPTLCYYQHGQVGLVPTIELRHLCECLMDKRNVGGFATQYVDLLNVAAYEFEQRMRGTRGQRQAPPAAPKAPPRKPVARPVQVPRWPDAENPATITRVGRSANGGELIMTLGMGTYVLHRDPPDLRYFDRGREWEIQEQDLRMLIDALNVKQDMKEHQYTYVDLLNIAMMVQERRRSRRR